MLLKKLHYYSLSQMVGKVLFAAPEGAMRDNRPAARLLETVFPRFCAICRDVANHDGLYLCADCRRRLPLIAAPICGVCGRPAQGAAMEFVCSRCRRRRPWFDRVRSAGYYSGVLRRLVRAFKYDDALWLREDLGMLLAAGFMAWFADVRVDMLAYVPLAYGREYFRGYNQARILTEQLAKNIQPVLPVAHALRRVRHTTTQTHLTAAQRNANVRGAFKAAENGLFEGRRVLVVDDVVTTGATLNECARVLKQAGAAWVGALTLARG